MSEKEALWKQIVEAIQLIIDKEKKYLRHMQQFGIQIISMNEIDKQMQLGSGGYGEVWKGQFKSIPVAVKIFKNMSIQNLQQYVESFFNDIIPQCKIRHHRFASIYGISYDQGLAVIQELCKEDCCHALPRLLQPGNERLLLKISYEIAEAMFIMHEMYNLVHRDLKCLNVLLDYNDHAKVCDFWLARNLVPKSKGQNAQEINQSQTDTTNIVKISEESIFIEVEKFKKLADSTVRFMAPEYFKAKTTLTKAVDTYAYGCTLLQL